MNKLILTSLFCSLFLLTGCGGGSSDNPNAGSENNEGNGNDDTGNGNDDSGNGNDDGSSKNYVNGIAPVVSLTHKQSFPYTVTGQSKTLTIAGGSIGNIEVKTENSALGNYNYIELSNSTPSLNVTDIQKTFTVDMSCDNGFSVKGTQNFDYSSGEVVMNGTFNGKNYSCTSKFTSPLPTTITNSSLDELLDNWGDDTKDPTLISSTCPADDSNDPEFSPTTTLCTGEVLTNFIITTSDPSKTHKISEYTEWK